MDSEPANKTLIVENLVDITVSTIDSIWPNSATIPMIPLNIFVKETLRRSHTTFLTIQLTLFYIDRIRNRISTVQRAPIKCGRRMFLAALILATKFLQDHAYSNKCWSKVSGLSISEINAIEVTFLNLIDYRLFVSPATFQKWIFRNVGDTPL